jgi:hypothetical protein
MPLVELTVDCTSHVPRSVHSSQIESLPATIGNLRGLKQLYSPLALSILLSLYEDLVRCGAFELVCGRLTALANPCGLQSRRYMQASGTARLDLQSSRPSEPVR